MIDKNIAEQYWEYEINKKYKVLTRDLKCIIQEVEAGVYKITLGIDSIMLDYFLINILEDKVIRCMRLDNQEYIDGTKEQLEKIKNIYNYKHYMTIIDKLNIPLYNNLWKPSKTDQFYFIDMVGKIQLFQKNELFMDNKQEFKIELIENYNAFTLDLANKARDLSKQERKKLLIEYNNYNGIEIILNDKEKKNGV